LNYASDCCAAHCIGDTTNQKRNRLSDRVEKLLDGTIPHLAHETFLVDALVKMRAQVNTASDCALFWSVSLACHQEYCSEGLKVKLNRINLMSLPCLFRSTHIVLSSHE
jgi:hypothetical protein